MNLDDRLRVAFTDLEERVSTTFERRAETKEVKPRMSRPLVVAAAAFAVVALLGISAWLASPRGTPAPVGTTPTPTAPVVTTPPSVEPPVSAAFDLGDAVALVVTSEGVVGAAPDGTTTVVLDEKVEAIEGDHTGGIVYQRPMGDGSVIEWLGAGAGEPVVLVGPGDGLRLLNVVELDGATSVAYTITTGIEEVRRETLWMVDLATGQTRAIDVVGGYESGPLDVSAAGSLLVIQTAAEGGVFLSGRLPNESADVSLPLEAECWNSTDPVVTCPWFVNITSDGLRFVYLDWNGDPATRATLTVNNPDAGIEHEVDLGPMWARGIDVSWPFVAVSQTAIENDEFVDKPGILVDFSNGTPEITELGAGTASVAR